MVHLNILLGIGVIVQGHGVCRGISFTIQGWTFVTNFIILDLGQVDVILGVQWLSTLEDCKVNWKTHQLSFCYQGQQMTLMGDSDLHLSCLSLTSRHFLNAADFCKSLLALSGDTPSVEELPTVVESVLHKFQHVFVKPSGLPPIRG